MNHAHRLYFICTTGVAGNWDSITDSNLLTRTQDRTALSSSSATTNTTQPEVFVFWFIRSL